MKNLSILIVSTILVFITSCTKVVDLKLNESETKMVVEGMISNQVGASFVKLAYTKGYLSSENPKNEAKAHVSVRDNEGNIILFSASENEGVYLPPADFVGEVGKTYTLDVQYEGGTVSAHSRMRDTVSVSNVHGIKADAAHPYLEAGYYLMAKIAKYQLEDSYYKAEVFVNGEKRMTTASDIVVFDDLLFEQNEELEVDLAFWEDQLEEDEKPQLGDVISLQLISINEETFDYLKALSETPMQGGIFGKIPANVPSNIEGGLGWFQASSTGSLKHTKVME